MNQQVVEHVTLTHILSKLHDTWSFSSTCKGFQTKLARCIWMRCHMTSYHDSTCGECLLSLSLSLHLLPLCRTCGITGTRTALTWLEPNTASNVKCPNISRALIWRQWKSVTCSAVCVPVHTTCDNQSFPILPGYATCHRQMVYCASDHWTLTRQYDWLPAVVTGMSLSAKPWTEHHRPRSCPNTKEK